MNTIPDEQVKVAGRWRTTRVANSLRTARLLRQHIRGGIALLFTAPLPIAAPAAPAPFVRAHM